MSQPYYNHGRALVGSVGEKFLKTELESVD